MLRREELRAVQVDPTEVDHVVAVGAGTGVGELGDAVLAHAAGEPEGVGVALGRLGRAEPDGGEQRLAGLPGLPAENNTHEVAQRVAPGSRIVYVDNDPFILVHARALLASHPGGATAYAEADLRDPGRILDMASGLLDFRQPVAVLLLAILHHVDDDDDPHRIVATLMNAVPPGS
jgi:hypothetical protein